MRVLRYFRWSLFGLVGVLLLALALLAGAWLWGGSSTSLGVVLSRVAAYLPADQSLEVGGVTGSLRYGGRIDTLRWRRGDLRVEAQNVQVGWTLPPLWDRELRIGSLRGQLRIDDRRAPTPRADSQPPTDLGLPIRVSVHFAIDTVQWQGPPALVASGLVGSYSFDSKQHSIDARQVKAQPLAQAQVVWDALDLAALWPQAPRTLLSGNASVTPAGATWRGTVAATNTQSGPWNTHALPLQALQAEVVFDKGSWLIQTLRAQGAGGEVQARGEADALADAGTESVAKGGAASGAWKFTASPRHINPHAVDTRFDADTLNGELSAAQTPAGIRFDAKLQAASPPSPDKPQGLRLQAAQARGLWRAPTLQLDSLLLANRWPAQWARCRCSTTCPAGSACAPARAAKAPSIWYSPTVTTEPARVPRHP